MTKKSELRAEIAELKERNTILEQWRESWLSSYDTAGQANLQISHDAVTTLMQKLGVDNMTMAIYRIEALLKNEHADKAILALNQAKATAEGAVRIHQLAIRQLEFQRDSAQKSAHDTGFELDNAKARCGELEELLRELLSGMKGGATRSREELVTAINVMLGEDL